jgi:tetratricopeptide (TPR) repeat protein
MIFREQGDLDRARSEYNAIVQSGDADGRVLFMLALLSIQTGRISESEDFLRQAAERGLALDENEYFELGKAYGSAGSGYEERAIEFLKRSMGVRQNREDSWEEIAKIYQGMGSDEQAADAYVNLFKINQHAHSMKLKTAGEIYERIGLANKARDAYALFLDRRFSNTDVSMSLARIYYNDNSNNKNCGRLQTVLKGLDTIPEAAQMLADCGVKIRVVDASRTLQKQTLSPLQLTLRIAGGAMLVGGLTGGLVINGVVLPEQYKEYDNWSRDMNNPNGTSAENFENVQNLRSSMDSNIFMRNVLYAMSVVGFGSFAVTFFF